MSGKGIASNPILHKFASIKGGKRRVTKGFGSASPERRKEVASSGGKAKHENYIARTNSGTEEQ